MAKLTVDQYLVAAAARLAHLTQTYAIIFFANIATMFAILARTISGTSRQVRARDDFGRDHGLWGLGSQGRHG
ncbi:hypothetical protein LB565_05820 [Mesorhizobium sp. CA14]|uniref:hypothetical protein n=1 Tax=Mesorhizobium sp. CA14 TaxID=2876642 RepID=UPI001CC9E216|nr:hypothetical protein [Mesorhizobium sp. CA14]MBZ9847509.1 hypothetical protein [Mesorhizobium sp. CA14]